MMRYLTARLQAKSGLGMIVVTGGTGFIGKRLCRRLVELGVKPRALVRREDDELARLGVDVNVVDFLNPKEVSKALNEASVVIHCAANASFGNGPQYERDNVELTRLILEAVPPALERFVFLSTIGAVDRRKGDRCNSPLTEDSQAFPTSDYGRSKYKCESLLKESGLAYTIVRPTMVVGSDMRNNSHFSAFADMSLRKSFFSKFDWPGCMSVVHVDDLVESLICVSFEPEAKDRTFFCAGENVSIGKYLQHVNPERASISLRWFVKCFNWIISYFPFQLKAILLPALTASDESLQQVTGWKPRKSGMSALESVVKRAKMRTNPELAPGGLTVVTGAASGLGRAFAERLAPMRESILFADQDPEGLSELAKAFPHCRTCVLDLTDEGEVDAFLKAILAENIVTELFACAGIGARGTVQQLDAGIQKKVFDINVLSRLILGKACAQQMSQKQFGRIVFVSSSSAFQPLPYMSAYAASNSALLTLGESWGAELRPFGVQMLTICPGGMKTNFQKTAGVKELEGEKLMLPEEVVEHTMTALKKKNLVSIISFRSKAMALLARLLPRELSVSLWMRLMEKMR